MQTGDELTIVETNDAEETKRKESRNKYQELRAKKRRELTEEMKRLGIDEAFVYRVSVTKKDIIETLERIKNRTEA